MRFMPILSRSLCFRTKTQNRKLAFGLVLIMSASAILSRIRRSYSKNITKPQPIRAGSCISFPARLHVTPTANWRAAKTTLPPALRWAGGSLSLCDRPGPGSISLAALPPHYSFGIPRPGAFPVLRIDSMNGICCDREEDREAEAQGTISAQDSQEAQDRTIHGK